MFWQNRGRGRPREDIGGQCTNLKFRALLIRVIEEKRGGGGRDLYTPSHTPRDSKHAQKFERWVKCIMSQGYGFKKEGEQSNGI